MAIGPQSSLAILANWFGGSRGPITISLHTGAPGDTGANEATGSGYLQQPCAWTIDDNGATQSSRVTFRNLSAGAYSHIGIRIGGIWWDSLVLPTTLTVGVGGTLEIPPGRIRVTGVTATDDGEVVPSSPLMIIPEARRLSWDPGVPGGIPTTRQVYTTLTGLTVNGTGDNTAAINTAIQNAANAYASTGIIQEVVLPAGTIRLAGTINITRSGVVLRGQGMGLTKIRIDVANSDNVVGIAIRRNTWGGSWGSARRLVADAMRGDTELVVSNADGTAFQVGDVLGLDEEDDPSYLLFNVPWGGATQSAIWDKRQPSGDTHGPALTTSNYRSLTHMVEVVGKQIGTANTTLTIDRPLPMNFRCATNSTHPGNAEIFHLATKPSTGRDYEGVHWCGLEDFYITGAGVGIFRAAFCWIKNVEVDGNPGTSNIGSYTNVGGVSGIHLRLMQAYKCEVRGCYVHHTRTIQHGGGAYLFHLWSYTSECLVEDNIVMYGNKGIVGNVMGGSNVIAYNFLDNFTTPMTGGAGGWQEAAIDLCHRVFCHSALIEGNYSTNLSSEATWGNAGFNVFFRNFATGANSGALRGAYPYNGPAADTGYRRAASSGAYNREFTYIGNVLHADASASTRQYQRVNNNFHNDACVYRFGSGDYQDGDGGSTPTNPAITLPVASTFVYRHHNYDNVNNAVVDDVSNTEAFLDSFYLSEKPSFFGTAEWPWVDPEGSTHANRVKVLPAKARYDAM